MAAGKSNIIRIERPSISIYGPLSKDTNFLEQVLKTKVPAHWSSQEANPGPKAHPINFDFLTSLRNASPYHSTCLETKKESAVGLGFLTEEDRKRREDKKKMQEAGQQINPGGVQPPQLPKGVNKGARDPDTSKVAEALNQICRVSFQDVLDDAVDEFFQVGNGFIEVVRKGAGGPILGLHHIPASMVYLHVLEDYTQFYEIVNHSEPGGFSSSGSFSRFFAPFGESKNLSTKEGVKLFRGKQGQISEVIHLRKSSSQSRWYGVPDWLAAVPAIEVFQKLRQYQHDFFNNKAVPEFILFLLGQQLDDETFKKLEGTIKSNMGSGNSHKSAIINLENQNLVVQLEKLSGDSSKENAQEGLSLALSLEIVTSHRVPPLLAGIQVPGKMGAANEIVSTMKAFQTLVIGPAQHSIETTLKKTLGNPDQNGGLALNPEDFELCTITEEMEVEELDTVSRMRQEFAGPKNRGRDPKEGLKD